MLRVVGNGSVGHHQSAFLGFQLPLGVEQVQGLKKPNSVESNICVGQTLPLRWAGLSNPWIFCREHSNVSSCASKSSTICLSGSLRFERGMFDSNVSTKKEKETEGCADESHNDEEDPGLIPHQWRVLQDDLHKTKSRKKFELRLLELENAMQRAAELQLKRQKLEDASKLLKERVEHSTVSNQGAFLESMSRPVTEHNVVRQETIASSKVEENYNSSPILETNQKKKFDSELDRLFSEDEIACLKRSSPDTPKIYCERWPPLQMLVASGQFFFLDEFLKSNVDLNALDEEGYTPIHRAILGRKETAVNQLLRAGADVNIYDKDGASYLHYSAQTGSLNLVRLFVKYGLDMNHPDEDGWTSLHVATLTAREDIVRHLLIRGADKHRKTKDGHTPLDICLALGKGYRTFTVAKLLKRLSKEDMSTATELEPEEG